MTQQLEKCFTVVVAIVLFLSRSVFLIHATTNHQEESDSKYQLGPAPITAVKNGEVKFKVTSAFLIRSRISNFTDCSQTQYQHAVILGGDWF